MPKPTAALAVIVAIDLWSDQWLTDRVVLKVRSDNLSSLTLLTKMRPPPARDDDGYRVPNTTMAVVARELAMRLVNMSFPPPIMPEIRPALATSLRTSCLAPTLQLILA